MKKSLVINALGLFADEFELEKFIETLLFIDEIEKGLTDVQQHKTLDFEEIKQLFLNRPDK